MSQTAVELVVGLGNPGAGHAQDRHNAGFWLVDALAEKLRIPLREDTRYKAEIGKAPSGPRLLKPLTFMNLSGDAVGPYANYFRIPASGILVVHDELDLPAGTIRLKSGGGHGGHNGLRSIDAALGGADYLRLRIGIGRPAPGVEVTAHVLGKPAPDDRVALEAAIEAALDVFPAILDGQIDRVMNRLNRRQAKKKEQT